MKSIPENQPDGVPLYQLKITLKYSRPPIWRRVVVRADMTLDRLHNIIQIAMGWTDSHLHQFIVGSGNTPTYYGRRDPEFGDELLNEKRYRVADLAAQAKQKFIYEYDFGDGWRHDVLIEKILPPDSTFKHPLCLEGANACPPEDCGGIGGYYNMVRILSDPKHPEYGDTKEWVGDLEEFSLNGVNSILTRLRA